VTRVLSFDPGQTTGWCYQTEDQIIAFGQAKDLVELMDVCELYSGITDHVVIEDYVVRGDKISSHVGGRLPTIQMIGYLKAWSLQQKLGHPTLYSPRLKPIQQKQTGMRPVGKHSDNHWVDAYNHGRWYLIKEKKAPTAGEIEWRKKQTK